MKGMARCAMILAAFLVVAGAFNNAEAQRYSILGAGAVSCGSWTEATKEKDKIVHNIHTSWVLGYITAMNVVRAAMSQGALGDITKGTDVNGLIGSIDNWCRANPIETIDKAAQALVMELNSRLAD